MNQGVKPEDMGLRPATVNNSGDIEMEDAETAHFNNADFKFFESQPLSPIHITSYAATTPVTTRTNNGGNSNGFTAPKPPVVANVVESRKRKVIEQGNSTADAITPVPSTSKAATVVVAAAAGSASVSISEKSDNSNKIRRVQNKIRSQYTSNSGNVNGKDMLSASVTGPANVIAGNNGNKTRNNK